MSAYMAKMVECKASTFPLDNLTRVSTAVHSTRNFTVLLFSSLSAEFWHLAFFCCIHLLAPLGKGLSTGLFPP